MLPLHSINISGYSGILLECIFESYICIWGIQTLAGL